MSRSPEKSSRPIWGAPRAWVLTDRVVNYMAAHLAVCAAQIHKPVASVAFCRIVSRAKPDGAGRLPRGGGGPGARALGGLPSLVYSLLAAPMA
jgi:hypothetical protein